MWQRRIVVKIPISNHNISCGTVSWPQSTYSRLHLINCCSTVDLLSESISGLQHAPATASVVNPSEYWPDDSYSTASSVVVSRTLKHGHRLTKSLSATLRRLPTCTTDDSLLTSRHLHVSYCYVRTGSRTLHIRRRNCFLRKSLYISCFDSSIFTSRIHHVNCWANCVRRGNNCSNNFVKTTF